MMTLFPPIIGQFQDDDDDGLLPPNSFVSIVRPLFSARCDRILNQNPLKKTTHSTAYHPIGPLFAQIMPQNGTGRCVLKLSPAGKLFAPFERKILNLTEKNGRNAESGSIWQQQQQEVLKRKPCARPPTGVDWPGSGPEWNKAPGGS